MKMLDLMKELIIYAKELGNQLDNRIAKINVFLDVLFFIVLICISSKSLIEIVLSFFGVIINSLLYIFCAKELPIRSNSTLLVDVLLPIVFLFTTFSFCLICLRFVAKLDDTK